MFASFFILKKLTSKAVVSDSYFSIFHLNVQSIRNKVDEVEVVLHNIEESYDVLCFTEHWLTNYELDLLKLGSFKIASAYTLSLINI